MTSTLVFTMKCHINVSRTHGCQIKMQYIMEVFWQRRQHCVRAPCITEMCHSYSVKRPTCQYWFPWHCWALEKDWHRLYLFVFMNNYRNVCQIVSAGKIACKKTAQTRKVHTSRSVFCHILTLIDFPISPIVPGRSYNWPHANDSTIGPPII